eukprot:gb/GECG01009877.1/.p1 GENE.gb/GECG01009877.1/~~gb/GECG01009877.1/.p1  ORF type:complete len:104 (+),score=11.57 gb/GECG01009877.1/:1-312(+)
MERTPGSQKHPKLKILDMFFKSTWSDLGIPTSQQSFQRGFSKGPIDPKTGAMLPREGGMYRDYLTDEEAHNIRPKYEGLRVGAENGEELCPHCVSVDAWASAV